MSKNKNLLMLLVIISLFAAGFSGYQIYKRINLHLYGGIYEIKPEPVDLEDKRSELKPESRKIELPEPEQSEEPREVKSPEPPQKNEPTTADKKQKAVKTFFRYKNAKAKKVLLSGSFQKWKETSMKGKDGIWTADVYILPGNYFYHFIVDGKKVLDPNNPKTPMGESLVMVK